MAEHTADSGHAADFPIPERLARFLSKRFGTYVIPHAPDTKELPRLDASIARGTDPRFAMGDFTGTGTNDVAVILQRRTPSKGSLGKVIALLADGGDSYTPHTLIARTRTAYTCLTAVPYARMLGDFDEMVQVVRRLRREPPVRPPEQLTGRDCIYFGHYESDRAVFYFQGGVFVQAPFF